jgi:endoglucanase
MTSIKKGAIMDSIFLKFIAILLPAIVFCIAHTYPFYAQELRLNDLDYFEDRGVNIFVFSNPPGGMFNDSKTSGVEIIHHGIRTATNGDVRLQHTPEQWDPLAEYVERKINTEENSIEAYLHYPKYNFDYMIKVTGTDGGVRISVHLDSPLPPELDNRAGFNLEFLPAAYFERMYLMDGNNGLFPRHPAGPMNLNDQGLTEPHPLARGKILVLAPEDPERRVTIRAIDTELLLFDGRNKAQNGWYVVRSMIPPQQTGKVVEWFLSVNSIPDWIRTPMIAHSQVGYHPDQQKTAVIEHDKNDARRSRARLLKITSTGEFIEAHRAAVEEWGRYLRYDYAVFDFSGVKESGIYIIEYGDVRTKPFRIDPEVYADAWHLTLDVFFPVQMDHMHVREAYRVWHGASHLDDAVQAPRDYEHFDLYKQDASETQYEPGEHIPGLNIGGWYDAGDYDIRTQSQYFTVQHLVHAWEQFNIDRDNTTVHQDARYVQIHFPDGKSDILQQIEHGTLALIAQHRALGHAIPGIVASHLYQYTHLGDGSTKTDNRIYNPDLDTVRTVRFDKEMFEPSTSAPRPDSYSLRTDGFTSGMFDDRYAFTTRTSALNYGSAAALAAASRVLRGFNDKLADECLATAIRVWGEEQNQEPFLFRHGNTTGGRLEDEELKATVELLITTKDEKYARRLNEIVTDIQSLFGMNAAMLVLALPYMDEVYKERVIELATEYSSRLERFDEINPFGVPITETGWAGAGTVINFGITNYYLHKAFPDLIDPDYVYRSLNYIFGTHPGSNISFVSAVGTVSQLIAYGMNRADFSFIPGGIVPGVLILPPDFPENKKDWPFFWGQNEYVITLGASYLYLVNAVNTMLSSD